MLNDNKKRRPTITQVLAMVLKSFLMESLIKNFEKSSLLRKLIKSIGKYFIKSLIKNLKKYLIKKNTLSRS